MSIHLSPRAQDAAVRATGLLSGAAGGLAIASLYRALHPGHDHDPTLVEFCFAALGFLGLSLGSSLLSLGSHIYDRVEISARWAPRFGPDRRKCFHCRSYSSSSASAKSERQ